MGSDEQQRALARRSPRGLIARRRVIELELPVDEALARFRKKVGVPVLAKEHASLPPSGVAFAEVDGDTFVLYHPIKSRTNSDVMVGPGVEGRLVPTPSGSRLEIRSRLWAPTRAQAWRFTGVSMLLLLGVFGMMSAKAIGFTLLTALTVAVYVGVQMRGLRQRERDLLARVQRVFGPVVRTAIDEPYRGGGRALPGGR